MNRFPEWARSILLTFASALLALVTAPDFDATQRAAWIAAVTIAARTALTALLPGGSFGYKPNTGSPPELGDE